MSDLGTRLKNKRLQKNMTCEDVANNLGFNKGEISRYENGVRRPNVDTLVALADFFDCTTDYLLGRE